MSALPTPEFTTLNQRLLCEASSSLTTRRKMPNPGQGLLRVPNPGPGVFGFGWGDATTPQHSRMKKGPKIYTLRKENSTKNSENYTYCMHPPRSIQVLRSSSAFADAVLLVKDQPPADKFDLSLVRAIAQLPLQAEHVATDWRKRYPRSIRQHSELSNPSRCNV